MDNQHKLIKGYRDLTQQEIDLINRVKAIAEEVSKVTEEVIHQKRADYEFMIDAYNDEEQLEMCEEYCELLEWAEDGKRDLQVGFMKLVRSIAAPTTF